MAHSAAQPMAATGEQPVAAVALDGVTVRFGAFTAVDDVTIRLEPGRIHALVGQNGAGKTSLARAVMGLIPLAGGSVRVLGRELPPGDVAAARGARVEMVHQSFILPPSFTVAEALEMFQPSARRRLGFTARAIAAHWGRVLEEAGVDVSPRARIRDLPIESLQSIEIVRALSSNARVLILDEPTAVLAPPAIERLFRRLRSIRDTGVTVIVVLHKVAEVLGVTDTVSVLRAGRLVLPPTPTSTLDPKELTAQIIGRAPDAADAAPHAGGNGAAGMTSVEPVPHRPAAPGQNLTRSGNDRPILRLVDVDAPAASGEPELRRVSFEIRSGEIVGVAGVEGNGQRSLVASIVGLHPVVSGDIELAGTPITRRPPERRRRLGLRVVPFDRNLEGVSATSPVWENVAVRELLGRDGGRPRSFVDLRRLREAAGAALATWQVRFRSLDQPAGHLSGGNIQRLIFARELGGTPRMMVAAQPTRGLDVAATAFVHETLRGLRDAGAGVLVVSSDLDELLALSDRLLVLYGGTVAARFDRPFDIARVGAAMVEGVA